MIPILQRTAPYSLRQLRLVDCKLSKRITQTILGKLRGKTQLTTLCLQKAQYNETAVSYLCDIIVAGYLTTLDIAWSSMSNPAAQYLQILEALPLSR